MELIRSVSICIHCPRDACNALRIVFSLECNWYEGALSCVGWSCAATAFGTARLMTSKCCWECAVHFLDTDPYSVGVFVPFFKDCVFDVENQRGCFSLFHVICGKAEHQFYYDDDNQIQRIVKEKTLPEPFKEQSCHECRDEHQCQYSNSPIEASSSASLYST